MSFLRPGIARGCGWQHLGAYVNFGSFYLCGIPVAALLGFLVHLKGRGLWIGIQIGAFVQASLLSFITSRINWEEQVCSLLPNHNTLINQAFVSFNFLTLILRFMASINNSLKGQNYIFFFINFFRC